MAQVFAPGPLAITTSTGAHKVVPLNMLSTTPSGKIEVSTEWVDASDSGLKKQAEDWANYLMSQGLLVVDTSLPPPPPGPPFFVKSAFPGTEGDGTVISIGSVTEAAQSDASTMKMGVKVTNSYTGLTLATIGDIIGETAGDGAKPGIVFLSSGTPTLMPDNDAFVFSGTAPPKADILKFGGGGIAFTLEAPGDGGGGTLTAEISNSTSGGTTFDLKITWERNETTEKKLSELADEFSYVVTITPPPNGIYGVPKSNSSVTLGGGEDPKPVVEPATPATGDAIPA